MADEDIVARMERMLAEKEKETLVKKVAKNGGGLLAGGVVGSLVVAPAVVWGVGAVLAPFTGGLSLAGAAAVTAAAVAGSAVVGHKMAKDID
jgi:hypothetical protein